MQLLHMSSPSPSSACDPSQQLPTAAAAAAAALPPPLDQREQNNGCRQISLGLNSRKKSLFERLSDLTGKKWKKEHSATLSQNLGLPLRKKEQISSLKPAPDSQAKKEEAACDDDDFPNFPTKIFPSKKN